MPHAAMRFQKEDEEINLEQDTFPSCRAPSGLEMISSSPHISPVNDDKRKRWFSSTRASSLLDDHEEEDDDVGVLEPLLARIRENSSSSESYAHDVNNVPVIITNISPLEEAPEDEPGSPLVRFSESMASFLCPVDLVECSDNQPEYPMPVSQSLHERAASETDLLQRLASSGPCGSSQAFNENVNTGAVAHEITQQSPPPPSGNQVPCSDIDLVELRSFLVTDISMLLGTANERNWMATLQAWLAEPNSTANNIDGRRGIYNRSTHRRDQSRHVRDVLLKWHGHPDACEVTNLHACAFSKRLSFDDVQTLPSPPVDVVDCFYDSDPEIYDRNRATMKQPARPSAIDTNASFGSTGYGNVPLTPKAAQRFSALSFESRSPQDHAVESFVREDVDGFDLWDDQRVKEFVQHLTLGQRHGLVWHPPSQEHKNGSPVSVQCWFEMGSRLQSKLIQPKFMWRETFLPEIHNRKLSASCQSPYSLDILAIVRVLIPSEVDRSVFPYAKLEQTFSIHSKKEKHVFEAQSSVEREWFVQGLKLVIARLASMIIVGDDQMFLEFFSPWTNSPMFLPQHPVSNEEGSCSSKSNWSGNRDDREGSDEKPFYRSTNKKDQRGLWGLHETRRDSSSTSSSLASSS